MLGRMDTTTPLLWHIPVSHFNEKVRWALDFKRIAHKRRVLGPNYLFRAWRATRQGALPILWLDGKPLHDSTRIIAALEERWPSPALYPADAAACTRALALEDDMDGTLGPALRASFVTPLFRNDPEIALRALTTGMPEQAFNTMKPLARVFPVFYRWRHKISDAKLEEDRAIVAAALGRVEAARGGRDYLVGDAFSVADLTVAALLSPLLQPPEIQYPLKLELPGYVAEYREKVLTHPAVQWAAGIYRKHRGVSAEVPRHR
jgi:glutathione S-transferase